MTLDGYGLVQEMVKIVVAVLPTINAVYQPSCQF